MKIRCLLFGCFALPLVLCTSSASAGCWTCDGCCKEQVRGRYGSGGCSAVQMCVDICGCTNCQTSGSLCQGTAEPECDKPSGACEEHQTTRLEAVPRIVPNGDPIDVLWLIRPPALPQGGVGPAGGAACGTVV